MLGVLVSDMIYRRFPSFNEGELTKLRSHLVRKETLADIARSFGLPQLVIVGRGESRSGGQGRSTLLADTLEAVVGALYLTRGMEAAAKFIDTMFSGRFESVPSPDALKDPKTRLQECLQASGYAPPSYEMLEKTKRGTFRVVCKAAGVGIEVPDEAKSKREAEQRAAAGVLQRLPPA